MNPYILPVILTVAATVVSAIIIIYFWAMAERDDPVEAVKACWVILLILACVAGIVGFGVVAAHHPALPVAEKRRATFLAKRQAAWQQRMDRWVQQTAKQREERPF